MEEKKTVKKVKDVQDVSLKVFCNNALALGYPKILVLISLPIAAIGLSALKSADFFIKNPLFALLFYALNLFFVYLPFLLSMQALPGESTVIGLQLAISIYLLAILAFVLYLSFSKHILKKELPISKRPKKASEWIFGYLYLASIVGFQITQLVDIYLILHSFGIF